MCVCVRVRHREKVRKGSCAEVSLYILISVRIKEKVKRILIANSFNQCLLPVQSLRKIKMRGETSAQGSQCNKQSLKSVDESGFPLSTLIGYISLLFMFLTNSFVFLLMNPMLLRRQKSISLGAEVLELWTDL